MNNTGFEYEQLLNKLVTFDKVYDLIRMVDPKNKRVVFIKDGKENSHSELEERCYSI